MRFLILLTTSVFICFTSVAQDLLTKRNGEEVKVKVTEVTSTDVRYKVYDNQEGPVYTLSKTEVFSVKYQNGTKDIFAEQSAAPTTGNSQNMFAQGKSDAITNYRAYKPAGTGTLVTGLVSPLLGLVPAIACSLTPPKEENLGYTNSELMKNADYRNGYTQGSKKIKSRKVWSNWGIAFGANLLVVIALTSGN